MLPYVAWCNAAFVMLHLAMVLYVWCCTTRPRFDMQKARRQGWQGGKRQEARRQGGQDAKSKRQETRGKTGTRHMVLIMLYGCKLCCTMLCEAYARDLPSVSARLMTS
jgi:hypothetical protein